MILISNGKRFWLLALILVLTCRSGAWARNEQPTDAPAVLARARDAMGLSQVGDKVVHLRIARAKIENY